MFKRFLTITSSLNFVPSRTEHRIIWLVMNKPIVILTDFGLQDPFVGIMKGVIQNISPQSTTIDLNHNIPPGDIRKAAISLWQSRPYFSKDTVFLCVVDPGVGTHRRAIIAQNEDQIFIGPDNGLFSFVLDEQDKVWELANHDFMLPTPRATFHGRDIFAPAAALASLGTPGSNFGNQIQDLEWLPDPKLETHSPGEIQGEILLADQFGNLLTSLGQFNKIEPDLWQLKPWIGKGQSLNINLFQAFVTLPNEKQLSIANTFGEIPTDQCAALIGSSGLIELAANGQSAAEILSMTSGEGITLHYN